MKPNGEEIWLRTLGASGTEGPAAVARGKKALLETGGRNLASPGVEPGRI